MSLERKQKMALKFTLLLLPVWIGACAQKAVTAERAVEPSAKPVASYVGLGKESISPEVVKKFAPTPLPSGLSRKIQNLLDVRAPGTGLLHPQRKELFFSWRVTGVSQVWRLKSPLGFPIQMTGGEDATSPVGITQDGKWLVLSRDRAGEENPGIYLQSTEGGALLPVQHKDKVQTYFEFASEDSKYLYFRANDVTPESFAIYRYEIKSKKIERLFSEKGYWSISDYQSDGRLLLTKAITNLASEVYEWSPKTKKVTPVIGQNEKEEYVVAYGANEGEFIVMTPKFGEFRRLYSFAKGELKPISEDSKWDVSGFSIDRPRKHLVYNINEGGFERIRALDPKTFRNIKLPKFAGADHVFAGASTLDGRQIMLSVISAQAPKLSYSYEWTTGKLTQWVLPSAPEVDLTRFAKATLESYKTRDGVDIPMFVRRPAQCESKDLKVPCPVVVHFHGGPEAQSQAGFSVLSQMFVDEGFIFVEPNVRGSDGYGKTWIGSDDGPKRLQVLTDIPDAANFIRQKWSRGNVAPKVGVMGWSYGGYSAQIAMTKFAGSYDAGVALVGMSNLRTFLLNTAPYRRALRIPEYGDPEKDQKALEELSAINYLDRVKGPMLLIQGVSDPRVPAGEAVQMYEKMKGLGLSSGLILFADEGHGSQKRSNQVLEIGHTLQFFKQNLR
jgi:dipeptidyl aminopeptidase/acylaminoacyl peptidase